MMKIMLIMMVMTKLIMMIMMKPGANFAKRLYKKCNVTLLTQLFTDLNG